MDPGQSMNFLLLQTLAGADVNVINKLLAAGWSCDPFWVRNSVVASLSQPNDLREFFSDPFFVESTVAVDSKRVSSQAGPTISCIFPLCFGDHLDPPKVGARSKTGWENLKISWE